MIVPLVERGQKYYLLAYQYLKYFCELRRTYNRTGFHHGTGYGLWSSQTDQNRWNLYQPSRFSSLEHFPVLSVLLLCRSSLTTSSFCWNNCLGFLLHLTTIEKRHINLSNFDIGATYIYIYKVQWWYHKSSALLIFFLLKFRVQFWVWLNFIECLIEQFVFTTSYATKFSCMLLEN